MTKGNGMSGLFTVVSDELITDIRLSAAKCGSISALARRMGIHERTIRRVICQRVVGEDWIDRYCREAPTALWWTDFDWKPWGELMDELDPEWRKRRRNKRGWTYGDGSIHEPSDDGPGSVPDAE